MKTAPLPENEEARLKVLRDLQILDTSSEAIFDNLTELTAQICKAPMVAVSLVDANRVWVKSSYGIDAKETDRDLTFCSHTILQDDIFEIEDSFNDPRFFDNPYVQGDPGVRFYAGFPLKTSQGHNVGTLCAIDKEPRLLDDFQRRALKLLAQQVVSQLESRKFILDFTQANPRDIDQNYHSQMLHLKVLADLCLNELDKGNIENAKEILDKFSNKLR